MGRDIFALFVLSSILMIMTSVLTTVAMEVYPDGDELQIRSVCPKNEGMGCENDEDCTTKISDGKLNEACTKCVCWHVPVCDVKK